ncbi:two-component response regulator 24-like [Trifolium pratense]|nr:two-component response regulator 24-like [Trifolium pratense]
MRIIKHESNDTPYAITALLVDGVTPTRRLEHHMFESIGIRTEPANSAEEAMQILSTGVNFDFIFVDFDLPITNGPQLMRQIRAMGIRSKMVGMLENYINNQNLQMFQQARADACITKPFNQESLQHMIGILQRIL